MVEGGEQTGRGMMVRIGALGACLLALNELLHLGVGRGMFAWGFGRWMARWLEPMHARYEVLRGWVIDHPLVALVAAAIVIAAWLVLYRQWLILWNNHLLPRIAGTYFAEEDHGFPWTNVDLVDQVVQAPADSTFIGMTPVKARWGRRRWEPVYLSERERNTHVHVVGKTGSGKTLAALMPIALQDLRAGKGMVLISGKGSAEEIEMVKGIAQATNRVKDLRVFCLPAWNRPEVFTHTYNMLYVQPRTPDSPGGDPIALAERVFKVLPLGNNAYYNQQAFVFWRALIRAAHSVVYEKGDPAVLENPGLLGHGIPFTMRDMVLAMRGIGVSGSTSAALRWLLARARDEEAVGEIRALPDRLGRDTMKALSGLMGACEQFQSPIVNAYKPDIILEDVLEKGLVVYAQLPDNLFKVVAPALGKVLLMDVQQEGSLRQIYRQTRSQRPFSVIVDEMARFADVSILSSLSQLRDAQVQFVLAHQSPADLEIVSKEFATSVWDNTRAKVLLNQDNPALCEMVAKSIGTRQEVLLTVRRDPGPLWTSLQSRVASSRQVESYVLHPNKIKNLRRFGQAYVFTDDHLSAVNLAVLPADVRGTYPLPRIESEESGGINLGRYVRAEALAEERAARAALRAEAEGRSQEPSGRPQVAPELKQRRPRRAEDEPTPEVARVVEEVPGEEEGAEDRQGGVVGQAQDREILEDEA